MTLPKTLIECPTCRAPTSMIEPVKTAWFCACCAETFELAPDGRIVRQPRRVDVHGHLIDGP